jgi:hypothetical protein
MIKKIPVLLDFFYLISELSVIWCSFISIKPEGAKAQNIVFKIDIP